MEELTRSVPRLPFSADEAGMVNKTANQHGFTLIEVVVTIGIMAIVSAIAIPNMIGWRAERQLRGAVNNLVGDLQLAKITAIREAEHVAVVYNTGAGSSYRVFIDKNLNWTEDADDRLLRNVTTPPGVVIDSTDSTNFTNNRTRFRPDGIPSFTGTVTFENSSQISPLKVKIDRVGRIRIVNSD